MLSNKAIEQAIKNKEIEISISFEMEGGKLIQHETEKALLYSKLKNNLYSDRLKLTMGPIVKVLNKKPLDVKNRFKKNPHCYDLRTSNNKYIINPGESIIILTNERIKLTDKYACIVIPRISLSDVGVVITTAYVDPYYDGIMRLHLTNFSDKAYELTSLEIIAQCFFFELSSGVSRDYFNQFSTKSVFFGQTWSGILDSDRDPFPTKKAPASDDKFSNLKYQLTILGAFIKKHSLIFLLFANIAVIVGGFVAFKQSFEKYTTVVEQVETMFRPTASEIFVKAGERYGEKEIVVKYAKSDIVSILCNNDEINYKLISGDVEKETKVIFYITLENVPSDEYEIAFSYVIVRRVLE